MGYIKVLPIGGQAVQVEVLWNIMFFTRIRQVGSLSLAALLLGGLVLIFSGLNGLLGPTVANSKHHPAHDMQRAFRYGSQLRIQAWIAVIGIGFGLLSYGFSGTYTHLFDWWCSRRSRRGDGLDYGTYLNSQPQAPILYGLRGFTGFMTIRYLLVLASVATSIGYKFAILNVELAFDGTWETAIDVRGEHDSLLTPSSFTSPLSVGNDAPPMLTDRPKPWHQNQAFWHQDGESTQPPESTIMTGVLRCRNLKEATGNLYTREIVLVANITDVEGDYGTIRLNDTRYWNRSYYNGNGFGRTRGDLLSAMVVEYKSYRQDSLDVRWAKIDGTTRENDTLLVERHLRYEIHRAVAEVGRRVEKGDCSRLTIGNYPIKLLSNEPARTDTYMAHENTWAWADALVSNWASTGQDAIGFILQVAMTKYAWTVDGLYDGDGDYLLRILPPGDHPFGPESPTQPHGSLPLSTSYPILRGSGWTATGAWIPASCIFMLIGFFAVLVALVRVYVGPPILTSWMGQHVYLAQTSAVRFLMSRDELATGYQAASAGLGKLKLGKGAKSPSVAC
jgi:hypothetical protein